MALPTLDATFASSADLPRKQMLAKWLVNLQYSGSIEDYWTLPEHYLWAKIAVAAGAPRSEADYISLPKNYVWSDIYNTVSGSSGQTIDRGEKEAIGWIAAAVRGDAGDPAKVATYISWPWRYQVASIIVSLAVDLDAQSFITTSGATDIEGIDKFVKGIKNLGLWNSMVCWPLRSSQNAGTGTTAYSLGGLGTFNGTLVNGPAWGADGLASAAGSIIQNNDLNNIVRLYNSYSAILVAQNGASGTVNFGVLRGGGFNQTGDNYAAFARQFNFFSQAQIYLTGGTTNRQWGSLSFGASGYNFFGANRSDISDPATSNGSIILNGQENNDKSGTGELPSTNPFSQNFIVIGAGATGHVFSFSAILSPQSPQNIQAIRNVYKSTLGVGLGLP